MYDTALGQFMTQDPMLEEHASWSSYAYTYNNTILYTDPIGLDTFNINVDGTVIDRIPVANSKSHIYNLSSNGEVITAYSLDINDLCLVKFPDSGLGFSPYGQLDVGEIEAIKQCEDGSGGSTSNPGFGDHFLKPKDAARLFGLVIEMYLDDNNFRVKFGDMSNEWGQAPWQARSGRHSTHGGLNGAYYSGVSIDYEYLDYDNQSYRELATEDRFNSFYNTLFLLIAKEWVINHNYISPQAIFWKGLKVPGSEHMKGHNTHGHLMIK